MNFRPKQYYVSMKTKLKEAMQAAGGAYSVYYRKDDGKLGQFNVAGQESHKDAILTVKEALVAEGDCLTNKAVLAVIKGGSTNDN